MSLIEYRSDFSVELIEKMGTDMSFVQAAKVSTLSDVQVAREESTAEYGSVAEIEAEAVNVERFLRFLMVNRHHSPFEQGALKFRIEAPIVVAREAFRHRVASYNEQSGRYTEMLPVFYMPDPKVRPLSQVGKPGAYTYVMDQNGELAPGLDRMFRHAVAAGWNSYQIMLNAGVAKEVARQVLPLNVYTQWYVTMNPRALMNFLSLRTESKAHSTVPSYPMWEIARVAEQMEEIFKEEFPVTWKVWNENGREGA